MNPIASSLFANLDLSHLTSFEHEPLNGGNSHVSLSHQKNVDLSIVTDEGDRVTLSSASSLNLNYASYNQLGELSQETGFAQNLDLNLERTKEFSISVKGDLNREELKDIQNILKKIDKLARNFFREMLRRLWPLLCASVNLI
ncbi:MAG TPA: hypothetical protein VGB26_08350 [Nitrospiria bacterium]